MKHIVTMIILCVTMTVSAQRGGHGDRMKLSAEQQATIQTKKMTLALDLNTQQAEKVYAIQLEQAKKRKAFIEERKKEDRPELTREQRFEKESQRLDNMIAIQREMKSILTADQYELWRKLKLRSKQKRGKKHHARRR